MKAHGRRIVKIRRLIKPDDSYRLGFPGLDFREEYSFHTAGEDVLLTDPTYLADVYNSKGKIASFMRANGVFVMNFGGDVGGPVWYKHPDVLLPFSYNPAEERKTPRDVTVLAKEVGTDSGSYIFLPLKRNLPSELQHTIKKVLAAKTGAALPLPAGKWTVYYEQWDTPKGSYPTFYRNIVVCAEL